MLRRLIVKANIFFSDGALCGIHKAENILRSFGQKIIIGTFLHGGFNEDKFKPGLEPKLRRQLRLEDKFVLLFVGALGYRKGIHVALEALNVLKNRFKNLHFIIVGSGEYERQLKKMVTELNLQELTTFIPWLSNDELPNVFCSADLFLYPSIPYKGWEEQFGYSIAEASLCGLPILSTKSGSIDEALINGKTGIMVEPGDVSALAGAIEKIMLDRELGRSLGENGRKYIVDNYNNKIIAQKLFNLFQTVYKSGQG